MTAISARLMAAPGFRREALLPRTAPIWTRAATEGRAKAETWYPSV